MFLHFKSIFFHFRHVTTVIVYRALKCCQTADPLHSILCLNAFCVDTAAALQTVQTLCNMENHMFSLTHTIPPAWSFVEELGSMKWENRDTMFPWRREGSESRGGEVWVQGKREGDFHGTAEG